MGRLLGVRGGLTLQHMCAGVAAPKRLDSTTNADVSGQPSALVGSLSRSRSLLDTQPTFSASIYKRAARCPRRHMPVKALTLAAVGARICVIRSDGRPLERSSTSG